MRICITHCCAKKDDALKGGGMRDGPDRLYTATPTKRFMETCKKCRVHWAIFSDKYGVWFPDIKHEWYEKDPSRVSEAEFARLLDDFDAKLERFDEIWFYHNPGRFHPLYKRLLSQTKLRDRIHMFSHLGEIGLEQFRSGNIGAGMMKQRDSSADPGSVRVSLREAAQILGELHICKAHGPNGKINGPNCQNHLGHRDPQTGRWHWDVAELIREAERRQSVPVEVIQSLRDRYRIPEPPDGGGERETKNKPNLPQASRAELALAFQDACVQLDSGLKNALPAWQVNPDRRSLGNLIREASEKGLFGELQVREGRFVNAVRNALYHPTPENISDDRIRRATDSAQALWSELK